MPWKMTDSQVPGEDVDLMGGAAILPTSEDRGEGAVRKLTGARHTDGAQQVEVKDPSPT